MPSMETFGGISHSNLDSERDLRNLKALTCCMLKIKKSQSFSAGLNWMNEQFTSGLVPLAPDPVEPPKPNPFKWRKLHWRTLRKSPVVWVALISTSAMFIMYVFLIGYSLHEVKEDLESTRYHSYLGPTELDEPPTDGSKQVHVEIRVTGVDVLRNRIDAWVYFFPSREISTASGELNFPVYYSLKYYSNSFNASDIMDPIEITIPFLRGTHYYYPFDLYRAELAIDIMDTRTDTALPIEIDILVSTPSLWFDIFRIDNDLDEDADTFYEDNLYKLDIVITRPGFVVIFSVFVVFLMWALSLAVLSMAISITVFSPARPGAPYLGLSLTCLFALPNLRSTQPGVPPLGILIDVIGYFWYAWLKN